MDAWLCALLLARAAASAVPPAASDPVPATQQVRLPAPATPEPPIPARFDAGASQASFSVNTRWMASMTGRFDGPDGALEVLPDGRLRVQVGLRAGSVVFPDNARVTRWTRSEAFFDVARYPFIRFRSEPFPRERLFAGGALDGMLELRGVNKPARFVLAKSACAQPGSTCPIRATGRLSRRAFGMTRMRWLVGDEVEFTFDARLRPSP